MCFPGSYSLGVHRGTHGFLNEMAAQSQNMREMCVCELVSVCVRRVRWAAKHRHSKNLFLLFWSEFKCSSKTVCVYDGAGEGGIGEEWVTMCFRASDASDRITQKLFASNYAFSILSISSACARVQPSAPACKLAALPVSQPSLARARQMCLHTDIIGLWDSSIFMAIILGCQFTWYT